MNILILPELFTYYGVQISFELMSFYKPFFVIRSKVTRKLISTVSSLHNLFWLSCTWVLLTALVWYNSVLSLLKCG